MKYIFKSWAQSIDCLSKKYITAYESMNQKALFNDTLPVKLLDTSDSIYTVFPIIVQPFDKKLCSYA